MSVRVVRTDHDRDYVPFEHTHADAVRYDLASDPHVGGIVLHVFNAEHRRVATYAPGCWASAEILPEPVVNAAAFDDYPEAAKCPSVTLVPPAEAVLSETSEPYVSVSVSGSDADAVLRLIRGALRDGSLRIPTDALGA